MFGLYLHLFVFHVQAGLPILRRRMENLLKPEKETFCPNNTTTSRGVSKENLLKPEKLLPQGG
jgi:hypothetical protein